MQTYTHVKLPPAMPAVAPLADPFQFKAAYDIVDYGLGE